MHTLGTRVGILGNGQLAWMLSEAAQRMGLRPVSLTSDSDSSAFSGLHCLAFENEFFDSSLLRQAVHFGATPLPSPDLIFEVRNKFSQKLLLRKLKIPTSEFFVPSEGPVSEWFEEVFQQTRGSCVVKTAIGGYDGKGVWISKGRTSASRRAGLEFCQLAHSKGVPLYAEKKVSFRHELAVIGVRSTRGEFQAYPLVISEQENAVCKLITGPATGLKIPKRIEIQAHAIAARLGQSLGLVGSYGIEFFLDARGQLLVNEFAPRVHNSGHYTLTAAETSQFENHWRALLGLPLGSTRTTGFFAMLNLLGPQGVHLRTLTQPVFSPDMPPSAHLFWYGKAEIRPGRKLGHVNAVTYQSRDMPKLIRSLRTLDKKWQLGLKQLRVL